MLKNIISNIKENPEKILMNEQNKTNRSKQLKEKNINTEIKTFQCKANWNF